MLRLGDEIARSSSTAISAPFNPQAAPIGIRGTAGAVRTSRAVGIVDRVRRIRRAITAVGVTGRVRIIRIRTQLAPVLSFLVIETWGLSRIGVGGGLITVGAPITTKLVGDAVGGERTPGAICIGGGVRIELIRTEIAEIFSVNSEGEEEENRASRRTCMRSTSVAGGTLSYESSDGESNRGRDVGYKWTTD